MLHLPMKLGSAELTNALIEAMKSQFGWGDKLSRTKVQHIETKYFSVLNPNLVVVVEYPYVDKVFRNSYYRYYSAKAQSVSRDCIRLSFLIDTMPSLAGTPMIPDIWTNQYRGFMVLRPTELNPVGRNGISPSIYKDNDFVICKTNLPSSVNGLKVSVEAFPASSQDSETMVCAETAVWALMEYYGNRYAEYSPVRPSHIIRLLKEKSFSRQLPSKGLTCEQICFLLKNLNFQPILHPIANNKDGLCSISSFVESGIPAILAISNIGDDGKCKEAKCIVHAIICIGHQNIQEKAIDNGVAEKISSFDVLDYDTLEKKFVFIDDNYPAYCMDFLTSPAERYTDNSWKACRIRHAVFPLYEKILLVPSLVKTMAKQYLGICHIKQGEEVTIRTFLASNRSYRNYVCRNNMPQHLKDRILNLYLPKFIWVVEISTRQGLKHNYAEGLMLFDATEPTLTTLKALEMLYYNGVDIYKENGKTFLGNVVAPNPNFEMYTNNLR